MDARLIIAIDLGTTNCALAWVDPASLAERSPIQVQEIPQLVNVGEPGRRSLLPSFLYTPGEADFPEGGTALPWDPNPDYVVGELARRRGAENPVRLVASAKSWLSYGGANRTSPILPWGAPPDAPHMSPVDASAEYLRHLTAAFDHEVAASAAVEPAQGKRVRAAQARPRPFDPSTLRPFDKLRVVPSHVEGRQAQGSSELGFARQDILITVPASFDEAARELTLHAARSAGLENVTLLEEPQAAFYAWLDAMGDRWRRRVSVGDLVLVCDVGGGTTDFSLIAVSEENGDLTLERVAVGEHILLGGDNMDLALARTLQQRLESAGHRVDTWQLHGLWHQCRLAKESLLTDASQGERPVTLLGRGSRLIGGTITTALTIDDVNRVLLEGFFPVVSSDEMPARQRRVGLQELGLPYAADAAVTKHLARFLTRQSAAATGSRAAIRRGRSGLVCPTHVLFNGGVMKAAALRTRIVEVLNGWLRQEGFDAFDERHVLESPDLDHAVARGAAYYGLARRGRGIRIRSGAPRSYYVGIESAMPAVPGLPAPLKALCVVPFGMEEGTSASIAGLEFGLVVGEPAEFRFLSSTVRKGDRPGALIEDWGDDLEELSPLEVTLEVDRADDATIPVTLESRVTEIGTMELWCVARDGGQRWRLELNIRERDFD